jgi:hypothetical protein
LPDRIHGFLDITGRKRQVHGIDLMVGKSLIVNQRAFGMGHRVAQHTE